MDQKLLFIGLGNMGWNMSQRLLSHGYKVQGFDLNSDLKSEFEKSGGQWLEDLKSVSSEVVFSMLPGGKHIIQLYLKDQKLLDHLPKGALIVDCSTAAPEAVWEVYDKAKERGFHFLSVPVSGGVKGAKEGSLTFIAGGDKENLKKAEPYLKVMGKNIFYAGGGAGAGQSVKICNNMLLAIHMIGTSEAFALGQSLGLKPEILSDIMKSSSGNNWSLEKYNPCPGLMDSVPSSNDYKGGFSVRLMLKDLGLAKDSIDKTRTKAELGNKAFEIYEKHFEEGFADKDFSHIFKKISSKI